MLDKLLFGQNCPGCDGKIKNGLVCQKCYENFFNIFGQIIKVPKRLSVEGANMPVFSLCTYTGSNRKIINSWKNQNNTYLNPLIENAIRFLALKIENLIKKFQPICFVKIPSNPLSKIKKTFSTTDFLCSCLTKSLKTYNVFCDDILRRKIVSKNQVGLGFLKRTQNRQNATMLTKKIYTPVVLVDDILTTGASILDAEKVLAKYSIEVLWTITLATTPPRQ